MIDDPFQCRCVLPHDYGDRCEADRADLTIIEHVQRHGWHVVMVPRTRSVPDSPTRSGCHTLTAVLPDGQKHPDVVDGYQVALRQVGLRWYRTFFGQAIRFYRRPPFPVLQVACPRRSGPLSLGRVDRAPGIAAPIVAATG
ncbi:DUF4262 domain-containing protein [Streptomyces coelicoflavus]|uniref:DUF4262 domain-containing protein n=1 Tax=Streptomyces coelicoflavus TaxID=285562 RepID=UPI003320353B